jgi:hypothetical protein
VWALGFQTKLSFAESEFDFLDRKNYLSPLPLFDKAITTKPKATRFVDQPTRRNHRHGLRSILCFLSAGRPGFSLSHSRGFPFAKMAPIAGSTILATALFAHVLARLCTREWMTCGADA